jgi:hypothetical protein
MTEDVHILKVVKDGHDGLLVTFSDGTTAGYVAEELLMLRPIRERAKKPSKPIAPAPVT